MTQPYADTAELYFDAGWRGIIPLPTGQKKPAPIGYTGWNGAYPSWADIQTWIDGRPDANIALRLPPNVLGLDVDNYAGKTGAATLRSAEQNWGPLPNTWISTARTDKHSGIRLYRVPEGLAWPGELPGGGVETVHMGHRYVVAPPSVHPSGGIYRWLYGNGRRPAPAPNVLELPELPEQWIEGLSRGAHKDEPSVDVDIREWLSLRAGGDMCPAMLDATRRAIETPGSRHEHLNRSLLIVVRLAEEGHPGLNAALPRIRDAFLAGVAVDKSRTHREALAECERALSGAVGKVEGSPSLAVSGDPCSHRAAVLGASAAPPGGAPSPTSAARAEQPGRHTVLTTLADIELKPVYWLWKGRLALGTLGLLAGREGLGKSTLAYWAAARITKGELFGSFAGKPKSVLICATEDSWEHTIGPRLHAAGADPHRIHRIEVLTGEGAHVGLSLPRDNADLERDALDTDAALLLLDPLMSRLDVGLDTHRDGEVRQALEPLVAIADKTNMSILGLIHHNKSASADPLQLVMGSKAFTAVARSVHTVVPDPDDDTGSRRLFGTPKNNLGRDDLPTFSFTIEGHSIDTSYGKAWTSRLVWGEESDEAIGEAMRRSTDTPAVVGDYQTVVGEATAWLEDYLSTQGGTAASKAIMAAGKHADISTAALKRARVKLRLVVKNSGFPRTSWWSMPEATVVAPDATAVVGSPPRESLLMN